MTLVASATLVVSLVALWTLRRSWSVPWERPATITVALLTFDVVIVTNPVNYWISSKLYALTGVWNCEELIGHICYMIGLSSLLYLVVSRLDMSRSEFRCFVRYRIELPLSLAIPLMVAFFVAGPGRSYVPDTVAAETTGWLRAYWLTMTAFVVGVLCQMGQALAVLRHDDRSRKAATAYLWAMSVTAVCCVFFLLELERFSWVLVRCEVIAYAVAASYSWQSKVRINAR